MTLRCRPLLTSLSLLIAGIALAEQKDDVFRVTRALKKDPQAVARLLPLLVPDLSPDEKTLCVDALRQDLDRWCDGSKARERQTFQKRLARALFVDAADALWKLDQGVFAEYLGHKVEQLSALGADVLDRHGAEAETWALKEGLSHALPKARAQAASFLGRARARKAAPRLGELLASDASDDVREMCARALSRVGTDAEVPALAKASRSDRSKRVRRAATLALGWLGTRDSGDALFDSIKAESPPGTEDALRTLTGNSSGSHQESQAWWEKHRPAKGYEVGEIEGADTGRRPIEGVPYPKGRKRRCERLRVVYVFDVSGSIPNHRAQQREYGDLVRQTPPETFFDLIAFSTNVQPWRGLLVSADNRERRGDASDWIKDYDGRCGTTPLSDAMRMALVDYDVDLMVLCTDGGGNVGVEGEDTFNYVQAFNACRRVRILGVQVGGGGADRIAMERLSAESGCQCIEMGKVPEFLEKTPLEVRTGVEYPSGDARRSSARTGLPLP